MLKVKAKMVPIVVTALEVFVIPKVKRWLQQIPETNIRDIYLEEQAETFKQWIFK